MDQRQTQTIHERKRKPTIRDRRKSPLPMLSPGKIICTKTHKTRIATDITIAKTYFIVILHNPSSGSKLRDLLRSRCQFFCFKSCNEPCQNTRWHNQPVIELKQNVAIAFSFFFISTTSRVTLSGRSQR